MLRSDNVDAVLLATIHKLHAEQTIAAAQHGKHVLVEKPMMTNVADCDAMIAACKEAGVTLSVIQTLFRLQPPTLAAGWSSTGCSNSQTLPIAVSSPAPRK